MNPQDALVRAETLMLDMDGTLLDLAFDNYVWKELVPKRFAVLHGLSFDEARAQLMDKYASVQGDLEWYCLDHWCDRLGLDVVQLHHDVSHRIGYLPGALEFLRTVAGRKLRVLLVTNAHPDTLRLKDAVTSLGDYFDGMHSSHEYGHAKEHQQFWTGLQDDVKFDPETTLFVDDSPPVLASAHAFGIQMLAQITRPDSTLAASDAAHFSGVEAVSGLLAPD